MVAGTVQRALFRWGMEIEMDRRKEELKILKKTYRREKRRATAFWKLLNILSFLLCLAVIPGCVMLLLPGSAAANWADWGIQFVVSKVSGMSSLAVYGGLHTFLAVNGNFVWIALSVFVLIFATSLFMWIAGSRKLKRNDAFLSYRTLRDALKEEKKNM